MWFPVVSLKSYAGNVVKITLHVAENFLNIY